VEYLLLSHATTHGINEFLRASLSLETAGYSIAAIFARETLGSVQKASCYQENSLSRVDGEFMPLFVTA
jgi:hypothetical protein